MEVTFSLIYNKDKVVLIMCLKLFNKLFASNIELDIYSSDYEKNLFKKYGKCSKVNNDITLLVISDTHGSLSSKEEFKDFLANKEYDLCILLGDHLNRDIDVILKYVDTTKLYGLLGNHDYDYLKEYGIPNLNGKVIECNGLKLIGIQGSFKYKPVDFPSFTQEQSLSFLEEKEKADILLSHDRKFELEKMTKDPAHTGLVGITNYIYSKNVPIHIHGHIHENYEKTMLNNTKEYSVFGYKLINIKK